MFAACGESPHQRISTSGGGAYEASLDSFHDGFVVAWHDTRAGNPEIYFWVVDGRGTLDGPERRLTNDPHRSFEPDVETVGDDIAVAWHEVTEAGSLAKLGYGPLAKRPNGCRRSPQPEATVATLSF